MSHYDMLMPDAQHIIRSMLARRQPGYGPFPEDFYATQDAAGDDAGDPLFRLLLERGYGPTPPRETANLEGPPGLNLLGLRVPGGLLDRIAGSLDGAPFATPRNAGEGLATGFL